jgi:hypothetical protein
MRHVTVPCYRASFLTDNARGIYPKKFLQEKAVEVTKQKKKKEEKNLSPRNRKACHSTSTALLKSVAEI